MSTYSYRQGVNLVQGTRPFTPASDISWLKVAGLDFAPVCIDVTKGIPAITQGLEVAHRLNAQGLGAPIRPVVGSMDTLPAWWKSLTGRYAVSARDAAGIPLVLGNDIGETLADFNHWRTVVQPLIYAQVRKACPLNPIWFWPASGGSWEMMSDSANGLLPLWLPPNDKNIAIAFDAYCLQENGSLVGVDPAVVKKCVDYASSRGTTAQVVEFDGGEGSTAWSSCLQGIAGRSQALAQAGVGCALWHVSALLDDSGVLRPDVLFALRTARYAPPEDGSHSTFGPAGSSTVSFAATTTGV